MRNFLRMHKCNILECKLKLIMSILHIFERLLCTLSRNHSQLVEVGTQVMIVNHAPHEPGFKLKRRVSCT